MLLIMIRSLCLFFPLFHPSLSSAIPTSRSAEFVADLLKKRAISIGRTPRAFSVDESVYFDGIEFFWRRIEPGQCEYHIGGVKNYQKLIFSFNPKPSSVFWSCSQWSMCFGELQCLSIPIYFILLPLLLGILIGAVIWFKFCYSTEESLNYEKMRQIQNSIGSPINNNANQIYGEEDFEDFNSSNKVEDLYYNKRRDLISLLDKYTVESIMNKMSIPSLERLSVCNKHLFSIATSNKRYRLTQFWLNLSYFPSPLQLPSAGKRTTFFLKNDGPSEVSFFIYRSPSFKIRPFEGVIPAKGTTEIVVEGVPGRMYKEQLHAGFSVNGHKKVIGMDLI